MKSLPKKQYTFQIRLTGPEMSKLKALASIYGDNASSYVRNQIFHAPRIKRGLRFITPKAS